MILAAGAGSCQSDTEPRLNGPEKSVMPASEAARYAGEVVGAAQSGPAESNRWVLTVELDEGTVAESDVVQVAFDEPEIACDDGADVSPSEVPVGTHVEFVRVGDDAETMAPPIVGGRELRIDCQDDLAGLPVPTWDSPGPDDGSDGALLVGELFGEDAGGYVCFWLESDGERVAIAWPSGFSGQTDPLRVLGPEGEVVAEQGDVVGVGRCAKTANLGCGEPYREAFFAATVAEVNGETVHITGR